MTHRDSPARHRARSARSGPIGPVPAGAVLVAALLAGSLAACSSAGVGDDPPAELSMPAEEATELQDAVAADFSVETVADGLEAPWSIAFAGDAALISERDSGRILEISAHAGSDAGDEQPREVGTIAGVSGGGEGGLLGLAVLESTPDAASSAGTQLYVYSTGETQNRVERYELLGDPGSLSLGAATTVIDGIPAAGNHNGGRLAFGPDGMLYVTTGDAGDAGLAQDRDSLAGKILRLEPDGTVPADNPFPGSPVYSYGHRNPQGIAWAEDGTMYASEFGQNTWDELNIIEAGGNYGWPVVEGFGDDSDSGAGEGDEFIDPIEQWSPAEASPSGIAALGGAIVIANLRGERLRVAPMQGVNAADRDPLIGEHFVGEYGRLRDAVIAPDGSLWVLTNNTDGRGSPAAGDDRVLRLLRE